MSLVDSAHSGGPDPGCIEPNRTILHTSALITCYRGLVAIESNDLVLRALERIHHDISSLREGVDGLREEVGGFRDAFGDLRDAFGGLRADVMSHGDRLAAVESSLGGLRSDVLATNASLDVIHERLSFFERAATVATEGRARLDDRVDRQQGDVNELGERVSGLERRVDVLELG